MACCENPAPRTLEKNGRVFCGNCKRYLTPAVLTEPPPVILRVEVIDEELEEPPDDPPPLMN